LHFAIGSVKVNANKTLMQDIAAIVELLCAHGADVDEVDGCGLRPIHYCVKSMNIEAAKCLLERKANVNLPDTNNETALYIMAEEPYPDESFADMLLKGGGNLGQKKLPLLRNRPNLKQRKVRELIRKYQRN
jgi:ankyrin repeat protein